MTEPCRRQSGSFRAYFYTREEAETFANDPANHPVYLGDLAHLCMKCGFWHLSKVSWLFPKWETLHENSVLKL
jgi:hypothetical protein